MGGWILRFVFCLVAVCFVGECFVARADADILPSGHKSVDHKIVFEKSAELSEHRIVAAPIAGLSGQRLVVAGQALDFSSKYGTQFFALPASVADVPKYDREQYAAWPSARPPIGEVRSVPFFSPIHSALTTVKLVAVSEVGLEIEMVKHEVFGSDGSAVDPNQTVGIGYLVLFSMPVALGLAMLVWLWTKKKSVIASQSNGD